MLRIKAIQWDLLRTLLTGALSFRGLDLYLFLGLTNCRSFLPKQESQRQACVVLLIFLLPFHLLLHALDSSKAVRRTRQRGRNVSNCYCLVYLRFLCFVRFHVLIHVHVMKTHSGVPLWRVQRCEPSFSTSIHVELLTRNRAYVEWIMGLMAARPRLEATFIEHHSVRSMPDLSLLIELLVGLTQ